MKIVFQATTIGLLFCVYSVHAAGTELPRVREQFSSMQPGVFEGKSLRSIVPPESVKLIALIENHGKGSPITREFKPDWDSNELLQRAFTSNAKATKVARSATELIVAKYNVVTADGALFILEVLGDPLTNTSVTAVVLRGDGFGCRFEMVTAEK